MCVWIDDQSTRSFTLICERNEALDATSIRFDLRILVDMIPGPFRLPIGLVAPIAKDTTTIEGDQQSLITPDLTEDASDLAIRANTPEKVGLSDTVPTDHTTCSKAGPAEKHSIVNPLFLFSRYLPACWPCLRIVTLNRSIGALFEKFPKQRFIRADLLFDEYIADNCVTMCFQIGETFVQWFVVEDGKPWRRWSVIDRCGHLLEREDR